MKTDLYFEIIMASCGCKNHPDSYCDIHVVALLSITGLTSISFSESRYRGRHYIRSAAEHNIVRQASLFDIL